MPMLESLCAKHEERFNKFKDNISSIIEEKKIRSFYELTDSDKEHLTGMILNSLDDQCEWLSELKDADMIVGSLARYMTSAEHEDKDYFIAIITHNAIQYWGNHIDDFIRHERSSYEKSLHDNFVDSQIEQKLSIRI